MEIAFQLTADDFRHGMIAWRMRSAMRRWNHWFGFALTIPGLVLSAAMLVAYPHSPLKQTQWVALGVCAVWLACTWAQPWLSARIQFRRMPSAQDPMTVEISESGLRMRSRHADSQVAWSAYLG
jgi:peptidoglycan/LPS O-acetylase OafA/YrhL